MDHSLHVVSHVVASRIGTEYTPECVYAKSRANRDTQPDHSLQLVTVVASCTGTEYTPGCVYTKARANRVATEHCLQLVKAVASCTGTEYRPAHVHVKTRSASLEV